MYTVEFTETEELAYGRHEAMNSLMTNVQYSGDDIKSVVITSCIPNEGKSTTAFDLARTFAENGNRTILLDMDFRKTVLMSRYKVNYKGQQVKGLVQLLSRRATAEEVICQTDISNLFIAFAGAHAANPIGLLNGRYLGPLIDVLKEQYDMVIIDAPPIGSVIDAAIIAPKTDGVIMVVAYDQITSKQALTAKKQLETSGCNILGVAINKAPVNKKYGYYKYYGDYK